MNPITLSLLVVSILAALHIWLACANADAQARIEAARMRLLEIECPFDPHECLGDDSQ